MQAQLNKKATTTRLTNEGRFDEFKEVRENFRRKGYVGDACWIHALEEKDRKGRPFGQSLNIYSQIGLIMLIGLVTKNAILIVEFANQLRARGQAIQQAVIEASVIRLRPILMTSFATVFGILPIAIGLGAGAEARRPLGIAVVGGMLFSTFLTLVLVPVVYSLLARFSPVHDPDQALADADAQVTGDPTPQHAH